MADIVYQYSGTASRAPESYSGDPEHMRIVVIGDDGNQKEIFKGSQFSQETVDKAIKQSGRKSRLDPNY